MSLISDFDPITRGQVLINAPLNKVADALISILRRYSEWAIRFRNSMPGTNIDPRSVSFVTRRINGGLREALTFLSPLSAVEATRHVLVSTCASEWTGYFCNRTRSAERNVAGNLSKELSVTAVFAFKQEHTIRKLAENLWAGDYGGVQFFVYDRSDQPARAIECLNDGGPWVFGQVGKPYSFEDTKQYQARRKQDRFTQEMLVRYLEAMNLRPYDDSFFVPNETSNCIGIERIDLDPDLLNGQKFYSLDEIRKKR